MNGISTIQFGLRLVMAIGMGALVGLERQWRQRMAGTRTNALVAGGAAAFIMCGGGIPEKQALTICVVWVRFQPCAVWWKTGCCKRLIQKRSHSFEHRVVNIGLAGRLDSLEMGFGFLATQRFQLFYGSGLVEVLAKAESRTFTVEGASDAIPPRHSISSARESGWPAQKANRSSSALP
jgi:hypothetical protein